MSVWCRCLLIVSLVLGTGLAQATRITVAAASDLKFALDEIVAAFRQTVPGDEVEVVYGSSGKFHTQIQQGAPYDLFFSADIAYVRELVQQGRAGSEVRPYAVGRLALWSTRLDARTLTLASLAEPRITRVAIANPRHAPYGRRAEEALRAAGVWEQVEPKLVYGDNIAHAAQFVQSGAAQVGLIAQALAVHPTLVAQGGHALVPERLHSPLEQGYVLTRQGALQPLARRFADYMASKAARSVMTRYGFTLPGETGQP